MKKTRYLVWTLILLLSACSFSEPRSINELNTTITYYDTDFDFSAYKTYAIRDTVGLLSDDENEQIDLALSTRIIAEIDRQLSNYGYIKVDADANPDFAVNVIMAKIRRVGITVTPPWWWGSPWYPYWGWYGAGGTAYWGNYWGYWGWYPWGWTAYDLSETMLLTEIVDGQALLGYREWLGDRTEEEISESNPDEVPQLVFRWQALIRGYPFDLTVEDQTRLLQDIEQSFIQSPYLDQTQ